MRLPDYALVVLSGLYGQGDARLGELDFLGRTVTRVKQALDHFGEELRGEYEAYFTVRVGMQLAAAAIALKIWQGDRDSAIDLLDEMLNACLSCHTPEGRDDLVDVGRAAVRLLRSFGVLGAAI